MKIIFLLATFLFSFTVYSQQDIAKLRKVDALVNLINSSDFEVQTHTIKQDPPEMGLSMRTYLTIVINGPELKKYVNNVHATTQENGEAKKIVSSNTFYFDHNKLIKVEEFITEGDKKLEALWYYADDKPLYYTLKSDKAQARAELLLTMAKTMLEKIKL